MLEILKLEMRDFKANFNTQIAKMEEANDSILELITDIRLTMASQKNRSSDLPLEVALKGIMY